MVIGPLRSLRRVGAHRNETRQVERRVFVKAPPRAVWAALLDPSNERTLFPELTLGSADPAWPAAAAIRHGRVRLGLLRDKATVESLEARPLASLRLRVTGAGFTSEWRWRLEARAGGTRVVHDAVLEPGGRIARWLIRLGRDSVGNRVEVHLRALKDAAEAAWAEDFGSERDSRPA